MNNPNKNQLVTPEEFVLENLDLRKEIIKPLVLRKYKSELYEGIKNMLDNSILENWHKYCSCESCTTRLNLEIEN